MGLRSNNLGKNRRFVFEESALRYSYYERSDGLQAHTVAPLSNIQFTRKQR
jgi:hypothetical protein